MLFRSVGFGTDDVFEGQSEPVSEFRCSAFGEGDGDDRFDRHGAVQDHCHHASDEGSGLSGAGSGLSAEVLVE